MGGERKQGGVRAVAQSLELLGDRGVDPGHEVYARAFARWPDTERLFFRDHDHAIRDHMMFEIIQAVLDLAEGGNYARGYITTEHIHHVDDLTVGSEAYVGLFAVLRDVVADALGADWTANMARDWDALLAKIDAMVAAHA